MFKNLLLVVTTLIICEGLLRLVFPVWWEDDTELGWVRRDMPGYSGEGLVCIGDSFTEWGDWCPGQNLGVRAYGTVQQLHLVRRIRPDSVVLQLYANDYGDNRTPVSWRLTRPTIYGPPPPRPPMAWYERSRILTLFWQVQRNARFPTRQDFLPRPGDREILAALVDSIRQVTPYLKVLVIPTEWEIQHNDLSLSFTMCHTVGGCIWPGPELAACGSDCYDWTHHLSRKGSNIIRDKLNGELQHYHPHLQWGRVD